MPRNFAATAVSLRPSILTALFIARIESALIVPANAFSDATKLGARFCRSSRYRYTAS